MSFSSFPDTRGWLVCAAIGACAGVIGGLLIARQQADQPRTVPLPVSAPASSRSAPTNLESNDPLRPPTSTSLSLLVAKDISGVISYLSANPATDAICDDAIDILTKEAAPPIGDLENLLSQIPTKLRRRAFEVWIDKYLQDGDSAKHLTTRLEKMDLNEELSRLGFGRAVGVILSEDPDAGLDWILESSDSIGSARQAIVTAVEDEAVTSNGSAFFGDLLGGISQHAPEILEAVSIALGNALVVNEGLEGLQKATDSIDSDSAWNGILTNAARKNMVSPVDLGGFVPMLEQMPSGDQKEFFHALFTAGEDGMGTVEFDQLLKYAPSLATAPDEIQYRAASAMQPHLRPGSDIARLLLESPMSDSAWFKLGLLEFLDIGYGYAGRDALLQALDEAGDVQSANLVRRNIKEQDKSTTNRPIGEPL